MAVNKIVINTDSGERVLVDLTGDSVTDGTVFKGSTFHGADGERRTGTFSIDDELTEQKDCLTALEAAIIGKAAGGGTSESGDYPGGYSRVDYIQFAGTQAIDTGIVCDQDTKIKVLFFRESATAQYLYGVASNNNTASMTAYMSTSSGAWRFGNAYINRNITVNLEMMHTAIVSKTGVRGESSTGAYSSVSDFVTPGTLILGGVRQTSGAVDAQFDGKVLMFEVWNGTEQVLKLKPVVDKNGIGGFYDEISGNAFMSVTDAQLTGGNL